MTALVVGGSSEIGAAVGRALGGLGHDVVLWGRDAARLEHARDEVAASGTAVSTSQVDVTDRDALARAVDALPAKPPPSVVVWAAGAFDWADADVADPATWERLLDVNLTSAAVATRLLLPGLLAAAPSALVYIGSGASRNVVAHNAAYVASKHGLLGLAGAVWADVRDRGVKVSTVSPGMVLAGAALGAPVAAEHPDWLLSPSDVADAVAFVVGFPGRGCPTEVRLETQRTL